MVRSGEAERSFDQEVFIAPDGTTAAAASLATSASACHLVWTDAGLRVGAVGDQALRINAVTCETTQTLALHDVVRCAELEFVVDRLGVAEASVSIYPAGTRVAPVKLPTPADTAIEPDESLQLDAASVGPVLAVKGQSRWRFAAWAAGLLLVMTFLALSLVQRVALKLSPDDARVRAADTVLAWHAGQTLFAFPGVHRLRAERAGYRAAETTVRVVRGVESQAVLQLEKLPGRVTIDTGGVVAELSVDGKQVGQVPAVVEIAAGDRTLTLRAPRYLDQIARIKVLGRGEPQTVTVAMRPSFGVLKIASVPAGATVTVDGKVLGNTPLTLELSAGVRRIQLDAPGVRAWRSSVVVQAGEQALLGPIELGAADARLSVRSVPSGAAVLVGGALRGKTPLTVELSPGVVHDVAITRAGYDSVTRRVFAEAGHESTVSVKLVPRLVTVRVAGKPADAEVLVNGETRGTAPLELRLPAARQRIEVRKSGFESYSTELALAPGLDRTLQYDLVDPRDIVGNAPATIETKSGITLKLVAGGVFQMGSGRREQGRRPNEGSRRVTLQRPFYIGVTEVTNAQFRKFRANHNSGFVAGQSLDIDTLAASNVSWNDAVEFCNWLSSQEGLPEAYQRQGAGWALKSPVGVGYRLPTEAEWEYAARYAAEGKVHRYSWGDSLPVPGNIANLAGTEARDVAGVALPDYHDEFAAIAKPRQFPANALGLYDMTGNVSEWTTDLYSSYVDATAATDPRGPAEGQQHVMRGANWRTSSVSDLRLAWRDGASGPSNTLGFRVARYVAP